MSSLRSLATTTPGALRAATVSGGEWRLMLTSWDALLGLMERVVDVAGDGDAELEFANCAALIDRMGAKAFPP